MFWLSRRSNTRRCAVATMRLPMRDSVSVEPKVAAPRSTNSATTSNASSPHLAELLGRDHAVEHRLEQPATPVLESEIRASSSALSA